MARRALTVDVHHPGTLWRGLYPSRKKPKHPRRRQKFRSHLRRLAPGCVEQTEKNILLRVQTGIRLFFPQTNAGASSEYS